MRNPFDNTPPQPPRSIVSLPIQLLYALFLLLSPFPLTPAAHPSITISPPTPPYPPHPPLFSLLFLPLLFRLLSSRKSCPILLSVLRFRVTRTSTPHPLSPSLSLPPKKRGGRGKKKESKEIRLNASLLYLRSPSISMNNRKRMDSSILYTRTCIRVYTCIYTSYNIHIYIYASCVR